MAETRTAHPYHMYEAIHAQPDCIARVIAAQLQTIHRAADAAAARNRIVLAGIGTSLHAAMVAGYFLRHFLRAQPVAVQSFEFVHYPGDLRAEDALIVVSHRGWKSYSVQAVTAAKAAGALAVAFTGVGGSESMRGADHVVETSEQEQSAAHTKSYTGALAALALFAVRVAEQRRHITAEDARRAEAAVARVSDLQREALKLEAQARALAAKLAARSRWFFVGAGPNWPTACEGALKVKETSYLAAEGFQIEQFLHGPIAELDAHSAVIAHAAGGPGDHRIVAALKAAGEIGALRVLVATEGAVAEPGVAEHRLEVPRVSDWLSPLLHVVPVQLLAYFSALERATNPDACRRDHAAHARARQHFDL